MVVALVITPEGFPLAYEVMDGNTSDNSKRQSNAILDMGGRWGYWFRAAQAAGVSSASRWMETSAKPGNTAPRYSRTGIFKRRQLSTMDRMAATFGPACGLPTWISSFVYGNISIDEIMFSPELCALGGPRACGPVKQREQVACWPTCLDDRLGAGRLSIIKASGGTAIGGRRVDTGSA